MRELDISTWKEFRIGDLFNVVTKTAKHPKFKKLKESEGSVSTPAVSATVANNSIGFYVDESEHDLLQNYLVVTSNGVNSGFVTYHPERFAIVQDAFALRLLSDADLTESLALFLCAVLIKNNENYNWDNKSKWNLLKNDVVLLPVTDSGEPDWDFMESYMAEVNQEVQDRVAVVQSVESPHHEIDVSGWKEFRIGNLFKVYNGQKYVRAKRKEGSTLCSAAVGKHASGDWKAWFC